MALKFIVLSLHDCIVHVCDVTLLCNIAMSITTTDAG